MRIVIVGAVAGGASAAARARRLDEKAEIVLLERGPVPSFANCGLPYYIGGVIERREALLVTPQERLETRYRLDVRTQTEVMAIDRKLKQVSVRNLKTGETYDQPYDKLILSPGAAPLRPPIPGADLRSVYTIRDLQDADRLKKIASRAERAVVVGAGFVGLEMAENLVHCDIQTTVVELSDQILPPWDAEMVAPLTLHLQSKGLQLHLADAAERFDQQDQGLRIKLRSGVELEADFAVMSVGVRPENQLAVDAGLEVGPRGGIRVNQTMQTTDSDIYAVGDAVEVCHFVGGAATQIPLGGPANRQGRLAADHIFGRASRYRGTQGTAIVGLFDQAAAMTGQSEKSLRQAEIPYQKIYIHAGHHAGYYPGAQPISLKLIFSPESGTILGAQAVGSHGVDKRMDILATAIQAGFTVYDLEEAELCYAPQFGSAKDPVNMAGFVAAGVLRGDQPICHAASVVSTATAGECHTGPNHYLLDVRTPSEYADGSIEGAVNIPLDELRNRLEEIPKDRPIVAFCKVGMRGYLATRILLHEGYTVMNLSGGYTTYGHVVARQ
jgi:NADPH-dependent 2,4-dienoyl-CoA reductase/sulfur reductase-like enzyme/rhodanese-related sulfurtransferase